MEYSNDAINLVESVLSSVNESERWQYRYADALKKKEEDLKKKIENEKKKVEYYGKRPKDLEKLEHELEQIPSAEKLDNVTDSYRKGTTRPEYSDEYKIRKNVLKGKNPNRRIGWFGEDELAGISDRLNSSNKYNEPKHKEMHERIDKRTKAFDTTAKHEAALILIEALNTLLSE